MTSIRKIAMTTGMMLLSGVLMAQANDQSQAASGATATQAAPAARMHRKAFDPARETKFLSKKLNLSTDQAAQITPILADRNQQMQGLRADTSMSQQDRRMKFKSIRDDSRNKIEAVLNDQQKQQFEQMLSARRNHRKQAPQAQ